MSSKSNVPDAWDDDWVNQAKTSHTTSPEPAPTSKKLSKAERRAQQAEFNRKLWEEASAENPTYYIDNRGDVPLQSSLKPNVTVLSRKPVPTILSQRDPVLDVEKLKIEDDEDDEDGQAKPKATTAEERAVKAQREREEKQRKYDEARERLFGTSATSSGTTSPRSNTPVKGSNPERGRGRGRGGGVKDSKDSRDSRLSSSSVPGKSKQLYDPNFTPKPDPLYQQRKEAGSQSATPTVEDQVIRMPRGPDGSGRVGFGFAKRGGEKS